LKRPEAGLGVNGSHESRSATDGTPIPASKCESFRSDSLQT
jgi:hypothetical protein